MRTRTFYAGLALAALTMTTSCSDAMRHRAATLKAIAGAVANDSQVSREQPEGGDDLLLAVTPDSVPSMILERAGYVTSYNKKTKLPNWVAWHLTAENTKGSHSRKGIDFMEDEDVPTPRADDWDYYNSGYDRGHMCPAGDNKWDSEAMRQSFLFTNICPQAPGLNRGDWNEMENACRSWARENGDIYIVCGPILYKGRHKTIGKHKVVVPEAFFKVVLCMRGTPKAIGFIYKNEDGNRPKGDYVNSVDEVERITGFDFFQSLPDDVEQAVEATADLNEWQ